MPLPYGFGSLDLIRTATLAVSLLRLDAPVLLVDEELARLVAPRQFLGVGHRLSLGLVDARRSAGPLDIWVRIQAYVLPFLVP